MGIFDGIETAVAEGSGRRVFIEQEPGHYLLRIDNVWTGETRDGVAFFQADVTVTHVYDGNWSAGSEVCLRFSKGGAMKDMFLPKVRAFVEKTLLVEDVTPDDMDELCGAPEAVQWRTIEVRSREHTSKKTGNTSTIYSIERYVPKAEVEATIGAEGVERFYPDGILENIED